MFARAEVGYRQDMQIDEPGLWQRGFAQLDHLLLTAAECIELRELYKDASAFRSRIDMARYRFGKGEYQYFAYPLPARVQQLRETLYAALAPVATEWNRALDANAELYPPDLDAFLHRCHDAGQLRPTPLLLQYRAGDFNCLHQDVYGPVVFPFQVIIALSSPGGDYGGGELVLVEQQPRAQSKARVIPLAQGEGVVIATRHRAAQGKRGAYRVNIRHGVSEVTRGQRFTLGVIFHDAE